MTGKIRVFYASMLMVGAFLLTACGNAETVTVFNEAVAQSIHIGVAYPVESIDSNTHFRRGVELAVTQVNENGGLLGRTLQLLIRDDEGDAHRAMQIATTFYEQGITAVIGHWSTNICYFVKDVYEENGILLLMPAATGTMLFDYYHNYVFRMVANNQIFAEAMAQHMADNGLSRVAIFFSDDEYGLDFATVLEWELARRNIIVIDRVTSISIANVDAVTNRWRAFGCDAVVIAAPATEGIEVIRLIHAVDPSLPFFGDSFFGRISFLEALQDYEINLYKATYEHGYIDAEFYDAFYAVHGFAPDLYAMSGFAAVKLIADAVQATGTICGTQMAEFIASITDHPTIVGRLSHCGTTQEFIGFSATVQQINTRGYSHE
ncbi:MAG: ABC transporter substrate-binding protein [Defluviitaleaceae bacterium]|nr:ABC transporter substrate-binding protein [Defluviitaleaceae bacterium]MCL2273693.1 ABC transporter substrate-binding protein [Defluviitaleaceae bacterium]